MTTALALRKNDRQIAHLAVAREALARARTVPEVKKIHDMAAAAEVYATRQRLSEESINFAFEIKIEALAKLGALLAVRPPAANTSGLKRGPVGSKAEPTGNAPTLKDLGITKKVSSAAQHLAALPPAVQKAVSKKQITLHDAEKAARKSKKEGEFAVALAKQPVAEAYGDLRVCSMQDLLADVRGLDAIVTDPPYEKAAIPLYGELARLAKKALKPTGLLAVMTGQSYLPEILALMTEHMEYRWILAYLMPGGLASFQHDRHINNFWKPVLLFGGTKGLSDVVKSDVNDNDKRFDKWGQSESGFARLIDALTHADDLVCDPFMGGGTTAVVCKRLARRFVGCDLDAKDVKTSRGRLAL